MYSDSPPCPEKREKDRPKPRELKSFTDPFCANSLNRKYDDTMTRLAM